MVCRLYLAILNIWFVCGVDCIKDAVKEGNYEVLYVNDDAIIKSDMTIDETTTFMVKDWNDNANYQIMVSYPGYLPVKFDILHRFESTEPIIEKVEKHKPIFGSIHDPVDVNANARKLLDTEIRHVAISSQTLPTKNNFFIDITVKPINKVVWNQFVKSGNKETSISFTIEIETLIFFGLIPHSLLPSIITVAVVLIIVVAWIAPLIFQTIKEKKD